MDNVTELNEIAAPRGRKTNGATGPNALLLGPRDELRGTLSVEGDLRVEGTVEGELRATGDIDIETGSKVNARLEGRNVAVRGSVVGDVVATKRLSVHGTGSVTGDVTTPRLRVDDGTTVNGRITMHPDDASPENG
jgi:cytoskeletal protein CcmA (bactofilin family)